MRNYRTAFGGNEYRSLFLTALLFFSPILWASPGGDEHMDPSEGEIGGRIAVGAVPGRFSSEGTLLEVLPPADFTVHLRRVDKLQQEFKFRAGEWFQPPAGKYRVWTSSTEWISPATTIFGYEPLPFKDRGHAVVLPVVPAGTLRFPPMPAAMSGEYRLLRIPPKGAPLKWELTLRVPVPDGPEVTMPEGKALVAIWSEKAGRYLALSRPLEVLARATVEVSFPMQQTGTSSLVLEIRRSRPLRGLLESATHASVLADTVLAADVVVETSAFAYVIWYQLPPGTATIEGSCAPGENFTTSVLLEPGKIHRHVHAQPRAPTPDKVIPEFLPAWLNDQ